LKQNFFPLRGKTFTKNAYAKTFLRKSFIKKCLCYCSAKTSSVLSSLIKLSFRKRFEPKNRFEVSDTLPAYKSKEKGLSFEPKPLNTLINKN